MTRQKLQDSGFNNITSESGTSIMELSINKTNSIRTFMHDEDGNVTGFYLYNKLTNQYSKQTIQFN